MQPLSYSFSGGSVNIGNSDHLFFRKKVDIYNGKFGDTNPIGELKYMKMAEQYKMQPSQVCMQLEVSCQAELSKRSDCSIDSGDGKIICNGITYSRDSSINETPRSSIKIIPPVNQPTKRHGSAVTIEK